MRDALAPSLTHSHSEEPRICPYCNSVVPKLPFHIGPKTIMVQPVCPCEAQDEDKKRNAPAELLRKREIESRFSFSSLGERFADSTFDHFIAQPGTETALEICREYADTFPAKGAESLMIWGPYGNGKSHLAAAVAHAVRANGYIPVFQTLPELLARIRSTFRGDNKETEKHIMDALLSCDLLIIDDIGAEKNTDWVWQVLFEIVDGRYRRNKPIFYTTNLQPSELKDRVGPRIYDRMIETSILAQNQGGSYRMKIAERRYRGGN